MKFINLTGEWQKPNLGPGGRYSLEFLVGVCRPVQILTLFQTVIFHTGFQTRPLQSIPVFKPGLGAFWGTGCLHGGGGPQVGEVTRGRSPHLSRKCDQIKMRDYMNRRVTSPTWGPLHVNRP